MPRHDGPSRHLPSARGEWRRAKPEPYFANFPPSPFASSLVSLQAQEKFDYAAAVALAWERCPPSTAKEEVVFVLGTDSKTETYFANGSKFTKTVPPLCQIWNSTEAGDVGIVLSPLYKRLGNAEYQVQLYHAGQSDPSLRLVGEYSTLKHSRFPLKAGDILVITEIPKT
jgi:hypothetical protein